MTKQVEAMLSLLCSGEYKNRRKSSPDISKLVENTDELETQTISFEQMLKSEQPNIFSNDKFGFNRTVKNCPVFNCVNGKKSREDGSGNITPNYASVITCGFDEILLKIKQLSKNADDSKRTFYFSIERHINSILDLSDRYQIAAEKSGNTELSDSLKTVPHKKASNLYEACLFMKILLFSLRCARHIHTTLGRFDQYMYPYYCKDILPRYQSGNAS